MSLACVALSPARANRRRSRSFSTGRSISCACAVTGRRAATRCASTPPRARWCSPCPPRGSLKEAQRLRAEARRLDRGAAQAAAARRRRSRTAARCRCAACRIASCIAAASAARCGPRPTTTASGCSASPASRRIVNRRIGDFLKREAQRDLEAASRRYADKLGVADQAHLGARPVEPLGLVLEYRRAVVLLAADSGAALRARLSRRARGRRIWSSSITRRASGGW